MDRNYKGKIASPFWYFSSIHHEMGTHLVYSSGGWTNTYLQGEIERPQLEREREREDGKAIQSLCATDHQIDL